MTRHPPRRPHAAVRADGSRRDRPLASVFGPGRAARWRRILLRRVLALALLVAAGALVLREDRAADATVPVVRARVAVAAGAVLQPDDVETTRLPPAVVPRGVPHDPTALIGRRTTAAVAAGEVLTTARVVGPGALDGLPRGRRALALPALDPDAVRLVASGDRVDVHRAGRDAPLATDVLVLATPVAEEGDGLMGGPDVGSGHVVVAVSPADARALLRGDDASTDQGYVFAVRARR